MERGKAYANAYFFKKPPSLWAHGLFIPHLGLQLQTTPKTRERYVGGKGQYFTG